MLISNQTLKLLVGLGDHSAERLFNLLEANACDLRQNDNPAGLLYGGRYPDAFTPWWMVSEKKLGL